MTDTGLFKLLFNVRRSIRYHDRRRAFYERMHQITGVLTILLAGGVLFELAGSGETVWWLKLLGLIAAVFSAIDIIIGYARQANRHADLRKRFSALEIAVNTGEKSVADYTNDRLLIEQDEPPVYRALDLLCQNEQLVAQGYSRADPVDKGYFSDLKWYEALTAHLYRWPDIADGSEIPVNH